MKKFILFFLSATSFIIDVKANLNPFGEIEKDFNIFRIRPGSKEQAKLLQIFDIYKKEIDEANRDKFIKDLLEDEENIKKQGDTVTFEILQHLKDNRMYLANLNSGEKLIAIEFPIRVLHADKTLLDVPLKWISRMGTYDYEKEYAGDPNLRSGGLQRIEWFSILDEEFVERNWAFLFQQNNKLIRDNFVNDLKQGSVYRVKLLEEDLDCKCAKGKVIKEISSLRRDIVTCDVCNGSGFVSGVVHYNVVWNERMKSGVSKK
jgi:hypothetical protein